MEKIKQLFQNKVFLWSAVGVAVILVAAILAIVLLGGNTGNPDDGTTPGGDTTYTVQVSTNAGAALADVDVLIYADSTLDDLVNVAKTDKDGIATFTAATGSYAVVLKGVPAGYLPEASYPVSEATTKIVLNATPVANADLTKDKFSLGSVMFDFNITDTEGNTYVLSELLQQKKAVVLNFWYKSCEPCKAEFPYLQEAYELYSEDMAVLAMNHIDAEEAIAAFQQENGYTFPMVSCDPVWQQLMKLTAYPTTVIIDRYGMISLIHTGSLTEPQVFKDAFAFFCAEDYVHTPVKDILELPGGDVFVIRGSREILIPNREEFVRKIDWDAGEIRFFMMEGL